MDPGRLVFTLGTSTRTIEEFLGILRERGIARALEERGWMVVHVIDASRDWKPTEHRHLSLLVGDGPQDGTG